MAFKDYYSSKGECDVCGKVSDVTVCSSTMGPCSFAYCEECFNKKLEPYWAMVAHFSCAGRFSEDVDERFQERCRHILSGLNISEEQFIKDIDKSIKEMNEYYAKQSCDDEFDLSLE